MRGREVERADEAARHVPVRIHRHRDERIGSDRVAHSSGEIALGVGDADDAHRSVNVEEDPVDGQDGAELLEDLGFDRVVEVALDRATREGARMNKRNPLDIAR